MAGASVPGSPSGSDSAVTYTGVTAPQNAHSAYTDFTSANIANQIAVAAIAAGGIGAAVAGLGYRWAMAGAGDGVVITCLKTPTSLPEGGLFQIIADTMVSAVGMEVIVGCMTSGTANPFAAVADGIYAHKKPGIADIDLCRSVGGVKTVQATITASVAGALDGFRLEANRSSSTSIRLHCNGVSTGWIENLTFPTSPLVAIIAAKGTGDLTVASSGRILIDHADR